MSENLATLKAVNKTSIQKLHEHLDELLNLAEKGELYGEFGVTFKTKAGKIVLVIRNFEDTKTV